MNLFFHYIKDRISAIVLFLICLILFILSFILYQLPLEAVLYPIFLCCFIGCGYIGIDYSRIKKNHETLKKIKTLNTALIDEFENCESLIDIDYQDLIQSLQDEIRTLDLSHQKQYKDMIEYYTLWTHQIKTPIASMRLTLQNEDTPTSRKAINDLLHIEQYVQMALTFLRLDSTTSDYVFKKQNLDSIIRQCIKKYASEFIDRKLKLEYEPIVYTLITDEKWLCFVLEQILSNALKYTQKGSIKIYLKDEHILCIEDTGIGIAPQDIPRIFDQGYTGNNGRTDKKATGLGLYLCKRICDNLGIDIQVESIVNQGTTIKLNIEQYKLRKE